MVESKELEFPAVRVPDCNLQQPAWPWCSGPVNLNKSAYDRQINSPVEGTADLFSGRTMTHKPFFLLLSEELCVFLSAFLCVRHIRAATLFNVTTKNREEKQLYRDTRMSVPAHIPPVCCSLPPFFVLSCVYSGFYFCSKWKWHFVEHSTRNIIS